MANADAWSAGWSLGKSGKTKKDDKKSASDKSGSQTAWSVGFGTKAKPSSFAKGGKVKKTGLAKVHKGEIVLTAAQAKMCAGKPTKKKGAHKRITTKA